MSRNRETRTDRCAQDLVNAQVSINRAVFELNIREYYTRPRRSRTPDDRYTLHCVASAMADLAKAAQVLIGKDGARK